MKGSSAGKASLTIPEPSHPMQAQVPELLSLASLDSVRAGLQAPVRRRAPIWPLLLAATFAAIMGVSVAGVMILGPGSGVTTARTVPLSGR